MRSSHLDSNDGRAARIDAVIIDVLQRRLTGEHLPDEQVFVEYSELLPELEEELVIAAEMQRLDETTAAVTPAGGSGSLTVRCPNCQHPVAVFANASFSDINCTACRCQFSLASDANDTSAARTFRELGHFMVTEQLGFGGFGTVWKAHDTKLDRPVAIKIPRRGALDPEDVEKFLREARAAAQLKHPNIVAVHEVGRDDDIVYIVSDLVQGVSLSDWLSARRPTFREAAKVV